MKRYIRVLTACDTIIDTCEYDDIKNDGGVLYFINSEGNCHFAFSEKDIIAEADSIEELCDGYYIDDLNWDGLNGDGIYIEFDDFKDDFLMLLYEDKADIAGYGFIKTNNGFIYVAKMNEEGELELL